MFMRAAVVAGALAMMLGVAHADDIDPAELAFWQSIQNSTNPAEYEAYLQAYPHGHFVLIARIRAAGARPAGAPPAAAPGMPPLPGAPTVGGNPTPPGMPPVPVAGNPAGPPPIPTTPPPVPTAPPPVPAAPPPPQPAAYQHPEKIVLTPPNLRVGQQTSVSCIDFPNPTSRDELIIVTAGTPDVDINNFARRGEIKILWKDYAANCGRYPMKAGPFAPGNYEIRFMTQLYNNDGIAEVATRTAFTVR
jgi:hypothetical protein